MLTARPSSMPTLSRSAVHALAIVLAVASLVQANTAAAGVPRALRPGTRPLQFLVGGGAAWGPLCERPPALLGVCDAIKVSQEFAAHFRGDASGPALGLQLGEDFGKYSFEIFVAPKFSFDIQPRRDLGLYITPSVALGYRFMQHYWSLSRAGHHAGDLQLGLALKLVLADRWLVWLQFPQTDLIFGPSETDACGGGSFPACGPFFLARLNLLAGAGVSF